MFKCLTCQRDNQTNSGSMICICSDCLGSPSAPDSYHAPRGVMVPNPVYEVWKSEELARVQKLNPAFEG